MKQRQHSRAAAWVVTCVLVGLLVSSCKTVSSVLGGDGEDPTEFTGVDLRDRLDAFAHHCGSVLQDASTRINAEAGDLGLRRKTIRWRSRAIPAFRDSTGRPHALEAFLDTWALCVQHRMYFEEGDGRDRFGEHTHLAVSAAEELETAIEEIGGEFLTEEELAEAHEDVQDYADEHRMTGEFARRARPSAEEVGEVAGTFDWLVKKPLRAVNPFGGISSGAEAVQGFTVVADEFKEVIALMPEELSWRIETLLCDIEERGTIVSLRESMNKVSESSLALSRAADELPEDLDRIISRTSDELTESQAPLQKTLIEARETMQAATVALENTERVAAALERTTASFTRSGETWRDVGLAFGLDHPRDPDAESPAVAWDRTAQSLATAVVEMRQLIDDARTLGAGPEQEVLLEGATAASRATIDHFTWRAVQLVGVLLLAALVFVVLSNKIRRPA